MPLTRVDLQDVDHLFQHVHGFLQNPPKYPTALEATNRWIARAAGTGDSPIERWMTCASSLRRIYLLVTRAAAEAEVNASDAGLDVLLDFRQKLVDLWGGGADELIDDARSLARALHKQLAVKPTGFNASLEALSAAWPAVKAALERRKDRQQALKPAKARLTEGPKSASRKKLDDFELAVQAAVHIRNDPGITFHALARALKVSERHLRRFPRVTNAWKQSRASVDERKDELRNRGR